MNTPHDGGPAAPVPGEQMSHWGLSIRDYFAAQCLPALAGSFTAKDVETVGLPVLAEAAATIAYAFADALLSRRSRP